MSTSRIYYPSRPELLVLEEPPWETLTIKQQEIFWAHARPDTVGLKYKELADHFGIAYETMQEHLKEIRFRLGVRRRYEITFLACQYQWTYLGGGLYEKHIC